MNESKDQREQGDEGMEFVQRLLALKRYEQPDPYFETRNLAVLREKLSGETPGGAWGERWFGWLINGSVPAFRMLVVSCLLALLSVNLILFSNVPELSSNLAPAAERSLSPAPDTAMIATPTNESVDYYRKPVFVFEFPSNRQPLGPVQMGPASVPVRFDY